MGTPGPEGDAEGPVRARPDAAGFVSVEAGHAQAVARAGLECFRDAVLAFVPDDAVARMLGTGRERVVEAAGQLLDALDPTEEPRVLVLATLKGSGRAGAVRGVLCVTSQRLLFWPLKTAIDPKSWQLEGLRASHTSSARNGDWLRLFVGPELVDFERVFPWLEAERAAGLIEGGSAIPSSLPLGRYPPNGVHPSRVFRGLLVTRDDESFAIGDDVQASVGTAGSLAATRGRNVAAGLTGAAIGMAVAGPLGAVFGVGAGHAKHQVRDTQEVYLLVEGPDWAWSLAGRPSAVRNLEKFAAAIRLAGKLSVGESQA